MSRPGCESPHGWGAAFRRRFGRRGACLFTLGLMWVMIGVGMVTVRMNRFSRDGVGGLLEWFDTPPWPGIAWIVGGVVAAGCGLWRVRRRRDDWGFNGLVIPVVMWAFLYLGSWTTSLLTAGEYGRATNWLGFLIYSAIMAMLLLIANWPDPDDPHLADRTGRSWGV